MTNGRRKLRVGYVLKMFPRFSETFIMNEILELERRGAEVTVFSLIPPTDGRFHSRIAELRARVRYLPGHSYSEFWAGLRRSGDRLRKHKAGYARSLWHALECSKDSALKYLIQAGTIADWCREERLDHIHSHFASSPAHVAMYASMMTGIPFSFIAHAKDIYSNDVDWPLFRDLVRHSSFMVTVSDSNRDFLVDALGAQFARKIVRIYNGLDLDYFRMARPERAGGGILAVGRLVEKKGFPHLVRAVRLLKDRGRTVTCEIVGDGPDRAALDGLVSELKLSRSVKLAGPLTQDEVIRRMKAAAVFVLPAVIAEDGNRDALPTVLLEAMAVGLPVVSTDVVGIPEITGHGACGLLVGQRDHQALADAVERLIDDTGLRRKLVRAARAKVEKEFNVVRSVRTLHQLMIGARRERQAA